MPNNIDDKSYQSIVDWTEKRKRRLEEAKKNADNPKGINWLWIAVFFVVIALICFAFVKYKGMTPAAQTVGVTLTSPLKMGPDGKVDN